jgi:general L-amino acid transport system permease protein
VGSILPIGIEFVPSDDFGGFMLAFIIGIAGIILSLPLGMLLALGRQSDLFIINKICVIFIEVIRGVPLITLAVRGLAAAQLLPAAGHEFRPDAARDHHGDAVSPPAYIAEVIRGGLAALPRASTRAPTAWGSTTGSRCG